MNSKLFLLLLPFVVFSGLQRLQAHAGDIIDLKPVSFWNPNHSIRYSTEEIKSHLELMDTAVPLELNATVEKRIKRLVTRGKYGMENFLGQSARFFPIFEQKLREAGLPRELKFLSVVESGLNPRAHSPKGAAGLWQLIPSTARKYGLQVEPQVDERLDPHKSTEAALRFLQDLYEDFDDWQLAIAAYNCGPARVRRAIKRKGSRKFKKIKNHLPKETRQYVEKFTAMAYLMTYYSFYNLRPRYPDYNLQMTQVTQVYEGTTFVKLAKASGVSVALIRELNPSYLEGLIPANIEGNNVVLPKIGLHPDFEFSSTQILGDQ